MKPSDITAAAKAFYEATQGNVVAPEEIERRAGICRVCPARVKTSGVGRVSQILGNLANKHKVSKDISGYQCSICGCALMLLVPAKEPHVDSSREKVRRARANPNCWNLR